MRGSKYRPPLEPQLGPTSDEYLQACEARIKEFEEAGRFVEELEEVEQPKPHRIPYL